MYEIPRGKIKRYETDGAAITAVVAVLFYFLYPLVGNNSLTGLFFPANSSVWEYTKLLVVPYLLYGIVEFFILKIRDARRFFVAKAVGLWSSAALAVAFLYTYSGMFGVRLAAVDVIGAVLLAAAGFFISYRLLCRDGNVGKYWLVGIGAILLLILLEIVFTYTPPHIPLFEDPATGRFGIG